MEQTVYNYGKAEGDAAGDDTGQRVHNNRYG